MWIEIAYKPDRAVPGIVLSTAASGRTILLPPATRPLRRWPSRAMSSDVGPVDTCQFDSMATQRFLVLGPVLSIFFLEHERPGVTRMHD